MTINSQEMWLLRQANPVPENDHSQQLTGLLLATYSFLVSEHLSYIFWPHVIIEKEVY